MTTPEVQRARSTSEWVVGLDTTRCSPLHRFVVLGRRPIRAYLLAIGVTYLPLLVAALLSANPLARASGMLRLPFLRDWNVMFMFLVSFPALAALTVADQSVLQHALAQVRRDGVVTIDEPKRIALVAKWQKRFGWINIAAYIVAVFTGGTLVVLNYIAYSPGSVGYWITANGRLQPAGIVFLYCVFAFYALIPIYVFRSVGISFFLRDLVARAHIRIIPAHPDHCGGLRPVGYLGLRNQYALTVFGLNVVLLAIISLAYLNVPVSLGALMIAAAVAYVLLGPLVFMGPLLPFRAGMLRTKTELMGDVARRLRVELDRLHDKLPDGPISREDEELIERLRKIGAVVDSLPVWPFDAGTLRKFLTAYVVPVLGAAGYPLLNAAVGLLIAKVRS